MKKTEAGHFLYPWPAVCPDCGDTLIQEPCYQDGELIESSNYEYDVQLMCPNPTCSFEAGAIKGYVDPEDPESRVCEGCGIWFHASELSGCCRCSPGCGDLLLCSDCRPPEWCDAQNCVVMREINLDLDKDLIPELKLLGLRMIMDDEKALISYAVQKILERHLNQEKQRNRENSSLECPGIL